MARINIKRSIYPHNSKKKAHLLYSYPQYRWQVTVFYILHKILKLFYNSFIINSSKLYFRDILEIIVPLFSLKKPPIWSFWVSIKKKKLRHIHITPVTLHSRNWQKCVGLAEYLQKSLGWFSFLWNGFRVCLGQKYDVVFKMADGFQSYEKLYP